MDALLADLEQEKAQQESIKEKHQSSTTRITELDLASERKRQEHSQLTAELAARAGNSALLQEKIKQQEAKVRDGVQNRVEIEQALKHLVGDKAQRDERIELLRGQRANYQQRLDEAERLMDELMSDFNARGRLAEQRKQDLDDLREKLFEIQTDLATGEQEVRLLAEQRERQEKELWAQTSDLSRLSFSLESLDELIEQTVQIAQKTSFELQKARDAVEEARQMCADHERRKAELELNVRNVLYRQQTLKQLEAEREGYQEAVRRLLKETDRNADLGSGVIGPIAELLTVSEESELAIETALGGALHDVVTDTRATASRLIAWLKATRSGRVTFQPLDAVQSRRAARDLVANRNVFGICRFGV